MMADCILPAETDADDPIVASSDLPALPEALKQAPFTEDCAPRRLLRLFSGKWITMILHAIHLMGGSARPGALQRNIPGLSKKMMTQTLRELQERGLIARVVLEIMPPRVEYRLTPLGQRFIEPIELLYRWGAHHAELLDKLD
ncbi:winged helix-turn-helix transcriptional regulator [Asaia krungthepensis]|nr:helix-turn-helix domain-containing protein [Asaia krungthepensis]